MFQECNKWLTSAFECWASTSWCHDWILRDLSPSTPPFAKVFTALSDIAAFSCATCIGSTICANHPVQTCWQDDLEFVYQGCAVVFLQKRSNRTPLHKEHQLNTSTPQRPSSLQAVTSSHFTEVFTTTGCSYLLLTPAWVHQLANRYGIFDSKRRVGLALGQSALGAPPSTQQFLSRFWAVLTMFQECNEWLTSAFGCSASTHLCHNWVLSQLSRYPSRSPQYSPQSARLQLFLAANCIGSTICKRMDVSGN